MQTLDYIKHLLRKQALLLCCAESNFAAGKDYRSTKGCAGGCMRKQFSSRYHSWTPPENVISLGAARASKESTVGKHHADLRINKVAENGQLQDTILTSIVELLKPVDWASVHTLSRHTGVSHEAVEAHINELKRRGVVDVGERLIPPDRRTVAWLVPTGGTAGDQ